jgi:hypothetical protein
VTICSYQHRGPVSDRRSTDPSDKSVIDIVVTDPDSVTLASHTVDVRADIDIVTIAFEKVVSRILTQSRVGAAATDAGKRAGSYRSVTAAINVFEKRMIAGGGVRAADRVVVECD